MRIDRRRTAYTVTSYQAKQVQKSKARPKYLDELGNFRLYGLVGGNLLYELSREMIL